MTEDVLADAMEKMDRALSHAQVEFSSIRTGRATPAFVEKLKVDYYGSESPLQQLAGFSVPEARLLVIQPYDKSSIKAIEKAITASDLGITPSNDGQGGGEGAEAGVRGGEAGFTDEGEPLGGLDDAEGGGAEGAGGEEHVADRCVGHGVYRSNDRCCIKLSRVGGSVRADSSAANPSD